MVKIKFLFLRSRSIHKPFQRVRRFSNVHTRWSIIFIYVLSVITNFTIHLYSFRVTAGQLLKNKNLLPFRNGAGIIGLKTSGIWCVCVRYSLFAWFGVIYPHSFYTGHARVYPRDNLSPSFIRLSDGKCAAAGPTARTCYAIMCVMGIRLYECTCIFVYPQWDEWTRSFVGNHLVFFVFQLGKRAFVKPGAPVNCTGHDTTSFGKT